MVQQSFEGTWEEVARHASELAGRRVRLVVLDDHTATTILSSGTSLAEALQGYVGLVKLGQPSNLSERVKQIWGQGVLDKHRKTRQSNE